MSTLGWRKGRCKRGHIDPPRNKHGACIPCEQTKSVKAYAENKTKIIARAVQRSLSNPEARRDEQRAWRLGVSVAEIRAVIASCGMRCGACDKALTHETLCIDHDHGTGRIRGVLCRFCNALEGMLTKQPGRITKLIEYLRRCASNSDELESLDEAIKRAKLGEKPF